jgi:hypothetical protein
MLNKYAFRQINKSLGAPDVDLFASRLNNQLPRYVSWLPDPGEMAVDAFSIDWSNWFFYAFPPFCLIGKCLQKIKQDLAHGILVVPYWPTQPWFSVLQAMLVTEPLLICKHKRLLLQPVSNAIHPLNDRIDLLCCRLSGAHLQRQGCRVERWTSWKLPGD